jgi:hypothetical protein
MSNSSSFLHFLIFTDTGSLVYKVSNQEEIDASMQGILQAIFCTSEELNCGIQSISTDHGLISFSSLKSPFDDSSLIFVLISPNFFGDEEVMETVIARLFEYIHSLLVIQLGIRDLFNFSNPAETETLKKLILNFTASIKFVLNNYTNLNFLLQAERKYEINNESNYPIKHYLEQFKSLIKVEFMCLSINNSVVWSTQDW